MNRNAINISDESEVKNVRISNSLYPHICVGNMHADPSASSLLLEKLPELRALGYVCLQLEGFKPTHSSIEILAMQVSRVKEFSRVKKRVLRKLGESLCDRLINETFLAGLCSTDIIDQIGLDDYEYIIKYRAALAKLKLIQSAIALGMEVTGFDVDPESMERLLDVVDEARVNDDATDFRLSPEYLDRLRINNENIFNQHMSHGPTISLIGSGHLSSLEKHFKRFAQDGDYLGYQVWDPKILSDPSNAEMLKEECPYLFRVQPDPEDMISLIRKVSENNLQVQPVFDDLIEQSDKKSPSFLEQLASFLGIYGATVNGPPDSPEIPADFSQFDREYNADILRNYESRTAIQREVPDEDAPKAGFFEGYGEMTMHGPRDSGCSMQ